MTQRLDAALLGQSGIHHHTCRSPIGQLAGVAGGDEITSTHHRLQLGQTFGIGVRPVTLITIKRYFLLTDLAGVLVLHVLHGRDRHDLVVEQPGLLGNRRALLTLQGVFVLRIAGHVVALGHRIGGIDHAHPQFRLVRHQPVFFKTVPVQMRLNQTDRFNATRHHHRHPVHHHPLCSHRNCLQAGGTEPVNGRA